jgi:hypothetical protein
MPSLSPARGPVPRRPRPRDRTCGDSDSQGLGPSETVSGCGYEGGPRRGERALRHCGQRRPSRGGRAPPARRPPPWRRPPGCTASRPSSSRHPPYATRSPALAGSLMPAGRMRSRAARPSEGTRAAPPLLRGPLPRGHRRHDPAPAVSERKTPDRLPADTASRKPKARRPAHACHPARSRVGNAMRTLTQLFHAVVPLPLEYSRKNHQ